VKIADFIPEDAIVLRLAATDADAAVRALAAALARAHGLDAGQVESALLERERLGSTAIGDETAVPHGKLPVERVAGALGLSETGIDFAAPDDARVRIVVALVAPLQGGAHLRALASVGEAVADPLLRKRLLEARSAAEVRHLLAAPRRASPRAT
jgi:PTS system nitrogen regulatory IIA component